jgi:hypothetical protein
MLEGSPRGIAMLTNEMKRQIFMKLRTENFRASLRLEGLIPSQTDVRKTSNEQPEAQPKTKHAR